MIFDPGAHQYLNQIYNMMLRQERRMEALEHMLQDILERLQETDGSKRVVVEKIDYHFDQLKVEKLEGTLNIGLTQDAEHMLEQMAVNGAEVKAGENGGGASDGNKGGAAADVYAGIQADIVRFLEEDMPLTIRQLELEHRVALGKELEAFMMKDVRSQIGPRMQHYVGQYLTGDSDEVAERCRRLTVQHLKRDITAAVRQYIEHLSGKEEEKET